MPPGPYRPPLAGVTVPDRSGGPLAALALLIRREHTGYGGSVSVAQSEVMLSHQAADIAARELAARNPAASGGPGRDAPWGIFPVAGDDDWVAVTVRGDADWAALGQVIGRPDLLGDQALATRRGHAARGRPAALGVPRRAALVPAGAAPLRGRAVRHREHPAARRAHRGPARGAGPLLGEQTAQIAAALLGLSPAEITAQIDRGVLGVPPATAGKTASGTRKAS